MSASFTPGPWIAAPYSSVVGVGVVSQMGGVIASCPTLPNCPDEAKRQAEVNARLIAAAPELFEALQQFVNGVETRMIDSPADETLANITHRARIAIAKARGDQ